MYDIEISDLRKLIQLVKDKYDYDFKDYAMSSFKRRIKRIIELYKFDSVDALVEKLTHTPSFFEEFVSEVTVNVTEMFRDPSFWVVVRDEIIPNILSSHNKISIWHAGCSSGEEVFSMQILLEEMGIRDKSHTVATDIDTAIINRAKNASISQKNMELNTSNYERYQGKYVLDKYFSKNKDRYHFNQDILSNVSFRKHDLVKGQVFSKFDIVLCRNVMIYFNQTLQNSVLKTLHESLFKYGFLCIGSKESLIWCDISNKFSVINNEEKIYKKSRD